MKSICLKFGFLLLSLQCFCQSKQDHENALLKEFEKWMYGSVLDGEDIGKSSSGYLVFSNSIKTGQLLTILSSSDEITKRFEKLQSVLLKNTSKCLIDTIVVPFYVLSNKDGGCINFQSEDYHKWLNSFDKLKIQGGLHLKPLIIGFSIPKM